MSAPGSTGAGAFLAGEGLAGWDPLDAMADRPPRTAVPAPKFDPTTRRYVVLENGALEDEHPVIARARHLLGIRKRGLTSSPNDGIRLGRLREARREQRQREAEDAVNVALKELIDNGDLVVERVLISNPFDGTIYPEIRNLRAPQTTPVTKLRIRTEE